MRDTPPTLPPPFFPTHPTQRGGVATNRTISRDSQPIRSERYYGYIPDLLEAISSVLDLRFEISLVGEEEGYGHRMGPGQWDGMIGQLLKGVSFFYEGTTQYTISSEQ